jgi:mannose-6-phosphate isomerase
MAYAITGSRKDYAWGIVDGLAAWTGVKDGATQAELWFGVHPSGPAMLSNGAGLLSDHLGDHQAPLLVKLLAAARPLSVQVHPDAARAARAWQDQQQPGAAQIYPDPWEKTEMLVALTEFLAFAGWRAIDEAALMLAGVPGTAPAVQALRAGNRAGAIRALLQVHPIAPSVQALQQAVEGRPVHECEAITAAVNEYPEDAGALLLPLLNVEQLFPGDALYVPAGVPHSYVSGIGLEVMTTSDNVVRLGLTPKEVNIDEALAALRADRHPVVLRRGEDLHPAGAPFSAALLSAGVAVMEPGAYRLVLAVQEDLQVQIGEDGSTHQRVPIGSALVATAEEPALVIRTDGVAALVRHEQA